MNSKRNSNIKKNSQYKTNNYIYKSYNINNKNKNKISLKMQKLLDIKNIFLNNARVDTNENEKTKIEEKSKHLFPKFLISDSSHKKLIFSLKNKDSENNNYSLKEKKEKLKEKEKKGTNSKNSVL